MTADGARSAVTTSALVTGGAFLYHHLISESNAPPGAKLEPIGSFVVGWGFTYIALAILAEAEPELAGSLSLLVAAGAVLYNGRKVSAELKKQLNAKKTRGAPAGPHGPIPLNQPFQPVQQARPGLA